MKKAFFFILSGLTIGISYSQETFYSISKDLDSLKSANAAVYISRLEHIKKQFPDSFYIQKLDREMALAFLKQGDTTSFFVNVAEFLNTPDQNDHYRPYYKTNMCYLAYKVAKKKNDTLNWISFGEKRLFIYNRLRCSTGEREYKLRVFDELIRLYDARGEKERSAALAASQKKFLKKGKLRTPEYLRARNS